MSKIFPFQSLLPHKDYVEKISSKPYDVLSYQEVKKEIVNNPYSFLHITRPDGHFPENSDPYNESVYQKGRENLENFIAKKILVKSEKPCFYIYKLIWKGKNQTGLVALSSTDDYEKNIIKKHELTRTIKENDRINHMFTVKAQTGNVFLIYEDIAHIIEYLENIQHNSTPLYQFTSSDNVENIIWEINDPKDIQHIQKMFEEKIPCTYIADGHHRAASACKLKERKNYPCTHFLTTLFSTSEIRILPYHRVLKNIADFNIEIFLKFLEKEFEVSPSPFPTQDLEKGQLGFYYNKVFYFIKYKFSTQGWTTLESLDVNILHKKIFQSFFHIKDIRTDERIEFIGGIRGNTYIKDLIDKTEDDEIAFFLPPIQAKELLDISENNQIMPPKSTWFEPKLKDGLFIHQI